MGNHGVDLSNLQNGIKVEALNPLPSFVIAKASEGTTFIDNTYHDWEDQSEASGAQFGAYHFFHAENLNARSQAEFFMKCADPRSGLSLWVDYETYGEHGQIDAEEIALFIFTVKASFPEAKVGIYCNTTGYQRIQPYFQEIPFQGLWYANPSIGMTRQGYQGINWQIHQYATVNDVDYDYWDWDLEKIKQYYTWTTQHAT